MFEIRGIFLLLLAEKIRIFRQQRPALREIPKSAFRFGNAATYESSAEDAV